MAKKLSGGIIGGIIGGVALIILTFVSLLLMGRADVSNITSLEMVQDLMTRVLLVVLIIVVVNILVPLLTGVLAVKMAVSSLKNSRESFIVSALAGILAGLIYMGLLIVLSNVVGVLSPSTAATNQANAGSGIIVGEVACCLPIAIVYTTIMSMIGGTFYVAFYPFYPRTPASAPI